jgi:hypothetical protein
LRRRTFGGDGDRADINVDRAEISASGSKSAEEGLEYGSVRWASRIVLGYGVDQVERITARQDVRSYVHVYPAYQKRKSITQSDQFNIKSSIPNFPQNKRDETDLWECSSSRSRSSSMRTIG